ncbi:MAG: ATP-dependent DNA helicase RecG [Proteobacteria bacterium]|nr:ATP-dependent DNA helicase RecG [Pseudomonadota bacterium]MBI3498845.1 ATP-dependent DNA helicase RecG [Pseudomonadota bacterium]
MRPQILFPLFAPVRALPGIGPRLATLVAKLTGEHVVNLLWHLPTGLIDRRFAPKVADAPHGRIATMTVTVVEHQKPSNPRRPYRVVCRDETGLMDLVFFHVKGDWLTKALPVGAVRVVSAMVERFHGRAQMSHPDHIATPAEAQSLKGVEPVYPMTAGLPAKSLAKAVAAALQRSPDLPEWQDAEFHRRKAWTSWRAALVQAHAPEREADLDPTTPPRARLAYDELLANQLALELVRAHQRRLPGRPIAGNGKLREKVIQALPYQLTGSQRMSDAEIAADMASDRRMLRLLQGDVGSGKTVVAFLAMLTAIEAGTQAALMAPTEILARQHFATIEPLAEAAGIATAILTGRDKGKPRERLLQGLADGSLPLVVGTHALVQEGVAFKDLALAVIDEQHRFGVGQRVELAGKGRGVDVLVMTATPIPRTLMLAAYGDLDVSRLTEKPAGRKPVDTRVLPLERLEEVVAAVGRALDAGAKVFWVCPLVEESEALDVAAAEARHVELVARFGENRVGLVHGRLKGPAKDKAMRNFAEGGAQILVATTVIEVGVDVPAATVMVVEHAERFGLAQLHQLRGRIGRGERASTCLLLYQAPLGETAKARLAILRETEDGFRIAEEDLRLRGAGEVLGTRQSGLPQFRLADLAVHGELLPAARDDARLALERDPELKSPRGESLRTLLYLFERDAAVRYLRSG